MIPFILAVAGGYLIGDAMKDKTPKFGHGGTLEEQNNEMLKSNVKEIKHHAEELQNIVKDDTKVDAWVVAKAERSASDLSDITHYLDGKETSVMAKGGEVDEFNWKNTKYGTLLYYKNEYQGISITKNSEGKYYVTADEGYRFYNDFEPIEVDTISQAKSYANKEISYNIK